MPSYLVELIGEGPGIPHATGQISYSGDLSTLGSYGLSQGAQALLGSQGANAAHYGEALASASAAIYNAAQNGNLDAALNASIGVVAAFAPEAAPFYAAAVGVLESLPQAKGTGDPCAGQYKQGPPGPQELAYQWSSTGPLNPGDSRQQPPGSFAPWFAQQVLAAPNDDLGFFRALAAARAMNEGKINNCYSDALTPDALLVAFVQSWNASNAGGAPRTITRQLPNAPTYTPRPGGGFAIETDDHPPDEDAWTPILLELFQAANHGYQPAAGTSPRQTATLTIFAPPLSLAGLRNLKGLITQAAPKPISLSNISRAAFSAAPSIPVAKTPSAVTWLPAAAGVAAALFFMNPLLALAGLGATLVWRAAS